MLRLVLAFSIILGASAMAKDGSVQAPKGGAVIDQDEEFWKTEMGRDIDRMFNDFVSGKKTHEQNYEEFNAKWADKLNKGAVSKPPAQAADAPYNPFGFATPSR